MRGGRCLLVRESERQERWPTMHNTRSQSTDVTCFFFCLPVALSVDVNMSWTCSLSPTGLSHYFTYNRGVFVLFLCFLCTHLVETRILLLNSTNQWDIFLQIWLLNCYFHYYIVCKVVCIIPLCKVLFLKGLKFWFERINVELFLVLCEYSLGVLAVVRGVCWLSAIWFLVYKGGQHATVRISSCVYWTNSSANICSWKLSLRHPGRCNTFQIQSLGRSTALPLSATPRGPRGHLGTHPWVTMIFIGFGLP